MTLARIEIEQIEARRWVAEVEAGFPVCRRERVVGASFDEVFSLVIETYARIAPKPVKHFVAATPEPKREAIRAGDVTFADAVGPIEEMDVIDGLRNRAAGMGIDVDGRWGEARLRREIAEAEERGGVA